MRAAGGTKEGRRAVYLRVFVSAGLPPGRGPLRAHGGTSGSRRPRGGGGSGAGCGRTVRWAEGARGPGCVLRVGRGGGERGMRFCSYGGSRRPQGRAGPAPAPRDRKSVV